MMQKKLLNLFLSVCAFLSLSLFYSVPLHAEDWILDTSFAGDGIAAVSESTWQPVYSSGLSLNSLYLQEDGKMMAAVGNGTNAGDYALDSYLYQMNATGGRDSAFDDNSLSLQRYQVLLPTSHVDFPIHISNIKEQDHSTYINGIESVEKETIMVGYTFGELLEPTSPGMARRAKADFLLMRAHADGSIDTTFGPPNLLNPGKVLVGTSENNDFAGDVEVLSDGMIIVAGKSCHFDAVSNASINCRPLVYRFSANGILDTTYESNGSGGINLISLSANEDYTNVHIKQALDGRLYLAAVRKYRTAINPNAYTLYLTRLTNNGILDRSFTAQPFAPDGSFSTPGHTCYFADGEHDILGSLLLDERDSAQVKIYLSGISSSGISSPFISVISYNADGSINREFACSGRILLHEIPLNDYDNAYQAVLDSQGRIVLGGSSNGNLALIQLNAAGYPDASFGDPDHPGIRVTSVNSHSFIGVNKMFFAHDKITVGATMTPPAVSGRANSGTKTPVVIRFTKTNPAISPLNPSGYNTNATGAISLSPPNPGDYNPNRDYLKPQAPSSGDGSGRPNAPMDSNAKKEIPKDLNLQKKPVDSKAPASKSTWQNLMEFFGVGPK